MLNRTSLVVLNSQLRTHVRGQWTRSAMSMIKRAHPHRTYGVVSSSSRSHHLYQSMEDKASDSLEESPF